MNRKAFSLIEVLIAMVILTIGILGLLPLLVSTIGGNVFGNEMTVATILAQQKMEELKGVALIQGFDVVVSEPDEIINELGVADPAGKYTRTTSVLPPNGGIKTIQITVSWNDDKGNSHSAVITSLISNAQR